MERAIGGCHPANAWNFCDSRDFRPLGRGPPALLASQAKDGAVACHNKQAPLCRSHTVECGGNFERIVRRVAAAPGNGSGLKPLARQIPSGDALVACGSLCPVEPH